LRITGFSYVLRVPLLPSSTEPPSPLLVFLV
jgi:hypothetical protein